MDGMGRFSVTALFMVFSLFCVSCQLIMSNMMVQGQLAGAATTTPTSTPAPNPCKPEYDCKACVAVAEAKCYFCNTNKTVDGVSYGGCQLYPASQVFPYSSQCPLSDARWGTCWVNFEALIIAMSVIAGILLVAVSCCLYCCCCKRRGGRNDTHELKWERETQERQQRHADRRVEREAKMSAIRQKYGLSRETATYNRMD